MLHQTRELIVCNRAIAPISNRDTTSCKLRLTTSGHVLATGYECAQMGDGGVRMPWCFYAFIYYGSYARHQTPPSPLYEKNPQLGYVYVVTTRHLGTRLANKQANQAGLT